MNKIIFNGLLELEYGKREAFNSLRTNLQFCGADIKTLLFTSCQPNEGKSVTTFELARSMAESGKKVILIDADLRKSVMIARYKIQRGGKPVGGLSHCLSKQAEIGDIVCSTNVPGMDVIMTGPLSPNPTELLNGELFTDLLAALRKAYDAVIIDAPPLGPVIDAAVIAPKCDGVVLVIEANSTSYRLALDVKKQLEVTGCKILGVVMNKVKIEKSRYYKYYGEYK
ncbi:MAG: polysaccharide biosynthesis tyrosine autokinase [Bacillota bacterium]|nr:polysaccharide biosynthesis tyrosine autokinase [Bacillota bacterium]